jgi:hypothetical protein
VCSPASNVSPIWPASATHAADWPRLADAWGSLGHDLVLKVASGEPAGRRLGQLVLDTGTGLLQQQLLVLCLEQRSWHLGVGAVDGQLVPVSQQHIHRADASIEPGTDVGCSSGVGGTTARWDHCCSRSSHRSWMRQRGGSTIQCPASAAYCPGRQRMAAREAQRERHAASSTHNLVRGRASLVVSSSGLGMPLG